MPDHEKIFSQRLLAARKAKGLTQAQLGEMIGVSEAAIGHFERARQQPSFNTLCSLGNALEVSIDYLVGSEQPSGPSIIPFPDWLAEFEPDLRDLDQDERKFMRRLFFRMFRSSPKKTS